MPPLTLEFHLEAILEAWEARRWYAERNPRAALAFLDELAYSQEQVAAHPDRWPGYVRGTRCYHFRRFPYRLVYHIAADRLVVIAEAHARRRPGYWKTRRA